MNQRHFQGVDENLKIFNNIVFKVSLWASHSELSNSLYMAWIEVRWPR